MEDRVHIEEGAEQLSIEIVAYKDPQKHAWLKAWLTMWTLAGLIIIGFMIFTDFTRNEYMFLGIYLAFWTYFEYKIYSVYKWRSYGIERINIRPDEIDITREVKGRGIPEVYNREHITNFGTFDDKAGGKSTSDTYWIISKPAFAFDYLGRTITFGLQIEPHVQNKIFKKIERFLASHQVNAES